jgi:hypothetical protein
MIPLTQALPDIVLKTIAVQMQEGIVEAISGFAEQRGDEDTVTGGLIQAIRTSVRGSTQTSQGLVRWHTRMWKLRGRGRGAPEKKIGADAIFEIEVLDEGGTLSTRKSLPIQAKKEWIGRDKLLGGQAQKLSQLPGGGLIVDYRGDGYMAIDAASAASAGGDRRGLGPQAMRPLADVLSRDFLQCRIGSTEIYFDANNEVLVTYETGTMRPIPFHAKYRLRTDIRKK